MKRPHRALPALTLALLVIPAAAPGGAASSLPNSPIKVHFNQELIDSLGADLDVADPKAVFALVFSQLPDTARVYPTENYYYFSFAAAGQTIAGNLRLDVHDRDQGALHLGYFRYDESGRIQDRTGHDKVLNREDGVTVEKHGAFEYAVTYGGRTVRFLLNDLGMAPPRPSTVGEDEVFVGPVFDESGLAFFLMFSRRERHFFYVLDERRRVPEYFDAVNDMVLVGRRTGFAFYADRERGRKILIAVHRHNTDRNNYYDGPFDQLPDNYVDQTGIQRYIEEAYPEAKGLVDRYGIYLHQNGGRLVIMPYARYGEDRELDFALACRQEKAAFLRCITPDMQQASSCLGGRDCVGPELLGEATLEIEVPAPAPPHQKP
ncbi:MAG TPA: hypothetical protein VGM86_24005 [Thermoanaerobaculia bacterium]|jgi:hypothetical protein